MPAPVAFILKGYPRLSETFIAQEIRSLEALGLDIRIVSLRHPTDRARHPIHREIAAPVMYLPEYLYSEPGRVFRAWRAIRHRPGYPAARRQWRLDLRRDRSPNRVRRFGQALVLAHEIAPEISHLHAHFLHTPASVARYTAMILGLPWSVSAHAKDIWTTPAWEKTEKISACQWLTTCSAIAGEDLRSHCAESGDGAKISVDYHGLDLSRFADQARSPGERDGGDDEAPVRLLTVGRAVAKKGYSDLIAALGALPKNLYWHWRQIGGGPLLPQLQRAARQAGIADRIEWSGALPQGEVLRAYREADLFVLPCCLGDNGDRDGLPNVLMEAQSQGLACISTEFSAIPELIQNHHTGVLVPSQNPPALAAALGALIADPLERRRLGENGRIRVQSAFDHLNLIGGLAGKFGLAIEPGESRTRRARR